MSTENDARLKLDLWGARLFTRMKKVIDTHEALREAYRERTGLEFERDSPYTADDVKRANRILRSNGRPGDCD